VYSVYDVWLNGSGEVVMAKLEVASTYKTRQGNPKVDFFFAKVKAWGPEYAALRAIVLASKLEEDLKWGKPCYILGGQNVVLIHGFKNYCALLFMKGALLKDAHGLLVQQTEHVQAGRQLRFTSLSEIVAQRAIIAAYVAEAVALEKSGAKVAMKTGIGEIPEELASAFAQSVKLKQAFEALTLGRQRGYILYFSAAKQAKTRTARVAKVRPRILAGLGLDD
jgi:uncharacterized protein YdeI (YjbR/CyaY-like superfamily)